MLLADRAAVWTARPENRQLPSLWQWLSIRWWTKKKNWTPPQRKMMAKAGRHHATRTAMVALIFAIVGLGSWEGFGRLEGRRLRDRVLESTTADVPGIVKDMAGYRRWVDPLLQDAYAQAEQEKDARKKLHVSLALLPVDAGQVDYLHERLLTRNTMTRVLVTGVNDAPTVHATLNMDLVRPNDTLLLSSYLGNAIYVNTVDPGPNPIRVTIDGHTGSILTARTMPGVTLVGNGTDLVTLEGNRIAVNGALNGLTIRDPTNLTGFEFLVKIAVDDLDLLPTAMSVDPGIVVRVLGPGQQV